MIDYAARRFREEVATWPDGVYESDAYVDHDPKGNKDIHIHCKVTVDGDQADGRLHRLGRPRQPGGLLDLRQHPRLRRRADRQHDGSRRFRRTRVSSIRSSWSCRRAAASIRRPNKSVAAGTHHPGTEVGEAIAMALAQVIPERCCPQIYKMGMPTVIFGTHPETGQLFIDHSVDTFGAYCGAVHGQDGWGAMNVSFGNLIRATGEINESIFPVRHMGRDYATDTRRRRASGAAVPGPCTRSRSSRRRRSTPSSSGASTRCPASPAACRRAERAAPARRRCARARGRDDGLLRRPRSRAKATPTATAAAAVGATRSSATRRRFSTTCSTSTCRSRRAARDYGVVLTGIARRARSDDRRAEPRPDAERRDPDANASKRRSSTNPRPLSASVVKKCTESASTSAAPSPTSCWLAPRRPHRPREESDHTAGPVGRRAATASNSLAGARGADDCASCCADADSVVHGTTTADNTMIEMSGAVTGLITTRGHRDEIELRRGFKEDIWDPALPPPAPIAPRRRRIGVPERLDFHGERRDPARRGRGAPGAAPSRQARGRVARRRLHVLFHQPGAREASARDRRRGVSADRRLALARGHAVGAGVRAHQHDAGERLRRHRASTAICRGWSSGCATAGYRRELLVMQSNGGIMTPEYIRAAAGHGARLRADRRRDRGVRGCRQGEDVATSCAPTWAAPATTSA